jgi:archaellum component FlaG (FlaF/FlaG flagellin family)
MKIPYSAMREVEYEGNDLPVSIYWDNAGEAALMMGKYTVDVFADGNNIGTTTLDIK